MRVRHHATSCALTVRTSSPSVCICCLTLPQAAQLQLTQVIQHTALKYGGAHPLVEPPVRPLSSDGTRETVLSEVLQGVGYQNAFVGKWHVNRFRPWSKPVSRANPVIKRGFDYGFTLPFSVSLQQRKPCNASAPGADCHHNAKYTLEAIQFINNRDPCHPFFLYQSYHGIHAPRIASSARHAEFAVSDLGLVCV